MDKILVVGVDGVVGANLASQWAGQYQVCGVHWKIPVSIAGCNLLATPASTRDSVRELLHREKPNWVVYCGPGAISCWTVESEVAATPDAAPLARIWSECTREAGADFTLISSDAVFTGPWMFHRESGTSYCESAPAANLRRIEHEVIAGNQEALVVRTHAFGWAPVAGIPSFADALLGAMESGRPMALDCLRHSTPILATDLADVLVRSWQDSLVGIHHIAGAERVNPFRFACLFADQFGLPKSSLTALEPDWESRKEFGAGETSLQTRRIRKTLDVGLPLLRDGLARLFEQSQGEFRERFTPRSELARAA